MIPTPGRIVQYTLAESDVAQIRAKRGADGNSAIGNQVYVGETYPMVIVRAWGATEQSSVNGQVLLDGGDTLWVTSVGQGDGERKWREFPRV